MLQVTHGNCHWYYVRELPIQLASCRSKCSSQILLKYVFFNSRLLYLNIVVSWFWMEENTCLLLCTWIFKALLYTHTHAHAHKVEWGQSPIQLPPWAEFKYGISTYSIIAYCLSLWKIYHNLSQIDLFYTNVFASLTYV